MHRKRASTGRHRPQGLEILHEDRDILVVDKIAGLLTMGTDKEKTKTAYYRLTDYVRKGVAKSRNRVFIVHRRDREVSGILVFAKSAAAKKYLQGNWDQTEKKYLAVVHGAPAEEAATITSYLTENRAHVVHSTSDRRKGRLSHTAYKVLKTTKRFSLLEVTLLTGRKNQIRVHLAEKGFPIMGDRKYGEKNETYKHLALHAKSLSFKHPFTHEQVKFETRTPGQLARLVGGVKHDGDEAENLGDT